MKEFEVLQGVRELWANERLRLNETDHKFVEGKYSRKTKMLGLFTSAYRKRKKLVDQGQVIYGFVFKMYCRSDSASEYYPVWVLHSPHPTYQENPKAYESLIAALEKRYSEKKKLRREKVECALHERFADASSLLIDESLTGGIPVYLSIVYFKREHISTLRFGINLFLMDLDVSKEIIFLPERFWSETYAALYEAGFKEKTENDQEPTLFDGQETELPS